MAMRISVRQAGKLTLTIYDFEHAGDELPVHRHDESSNHITFVSQGDFRITGEAQIRGQILCMGDAVDWPVGQSHGFVALTNNARLIQVGK